MTLYICTAGTSILAPPQRGATQTAAERIAEKVRSVGERTGGDLLGFLTGVSAETNGLARSDCGAGDSVVLMASDTDDGVAAADAVAGIVKERLGARARVARVRGLQVRDLGRFRQEGVRNLLREAALLADEARSRGETVVFNVTGGFKGVVPYLTLLGMFSGIEVIYVYELSEALFRLPALPIRFDHERIAAALPALQVLASKGVMNASEFRRIASVAGAAAQGVDEFIETADGYVSLSGAGELAVRGSVVRSIPGKLFLHRRARQSGLMDHPLVRRALARINDPAWRSLPLHATRNSNTDLLICKMRGSTAPHLFYWVEGDDVLVAEIIAHDGEYDRFLDGATAIRRSAFGRDQFEEHVPPREEDGDWYGEELGAFVADFDAERAALAGRLERLEGEAKELRARLKRAEARADEARDNLARFAEAAAFAAETHRGHKRKDAGGTPYFHHLVEVVRLLAEAGISDPDVLIAGWLHDTIEDRQTKGEEIEERFGPAVRSLVEAVTDDKSLDKETRKHLQVKHASEATPDVRLIKLADKIANLRDILATPPADWSGERKLQYFEWAKQVVDALRSGASHPHQRLEKLFDETYARRLTVL